MITLLKSFLVALIITPLLALKLTLAVAEEVAAQDTLVLIAENDSPLLSRLLSNLKDAAPENIYKISTSRAPAQLADDDYAVLVGSKVPAHFEPQTHKKTIAVFVSEEQASQLQVKTSIWVEPPLSRQLTLANLVVPGDKRIGLLVNGEADKNKQLEGLSNLQKQQLKVVDLAEHQNINQALYHVLKNTRLLLGTYNQEIYSPANIKNILITSYRQQKVLIGPSRAYLKAGSFATSYSNLTHISQRLIDIIKQHKADSSWISSGYNPYYRVLYNKQVARSLNLPVMSNKQLEQNMAELMGEQ